jgi:hypothetical protein
LNAAEVRFQSPPRESFDENALLIFIIETTVLKMKKVLQAIP